MSDDDLELEAYWDDVRRDVVPRGKGKRLDLAGRTFGRLTVQTAAGRNQRKEALWACSCSCGGTKQATTDDLVRARVRSCGCLADEVRRRRPRGV
jgi:hypothetical protein